MSCIMGPGIFAFFIELPFFVVPLRLRGFSWVFQDFGLF